MSQPLIGITSSSGQGSFDRIEKVGRGYIEAVAAAGGIPIVLPTVRPELAAAAAARFDGLLLTGGGDIDPARWGAEPEPESGVPDAARDEWELALVAAVDARRVPILAICRGIQLLNVARGGTLVQHIPTAIGTDHDDEAGARSEVQAVEVVDGSVLHGIVGATQIRVNTLHHQAVGDVGEGLVVSGRADDGVIEAVESVDPSAAVLGVQWHPELLADRAPHRPLFEWLVARSIG